MIIAFIGNDGSGKSTLIKSVSQRFQKDVRVINEYEYFVLKFIKKLLSKKKIVSINKSFNSPHNKRGILIVVTPIVIWLDLLLEYYYLEIFYKKKIVIKDRYAHDFLMTFREVGTSNKLVEFLYKNFPNPYLTFYIYVDPLVAYNRKIKQNTTVKKKDFYIEKTFLYESYYKEKKSICKIINDKPVEKITDEIMFFIKLKERILKKKRIVVIGIDGSGKTTAINSLSDLFLSLNINYYVIHFYYNYIFLKIINFFKAKKINQKINYSYSIKNELSSKENKSTLWAIFVIIDGLIQFLLINIIYFHRVKVFDRFFHDYFVSFKFLKVKNGTHNHLALFIDKIFKKEIILFIAEPKILYKRKPEHTLTYFKECHKHYLDVVFRKNNIKILDSSNLNEREVFNKVIGLLE